MAGSKVASCGDSCAADGTPLRPQTPR